MKKIPSGLFSNQPKINFEELSHIENKISNQEHFEANKDKFSNQLLNAHTFKEVQSSNLLRFDYRSQRSSKTHSWSRYFDLRHQERGKRKDFI